MARTDDARGIKLLDAATLVARMPPRLLTLPLVLELPLRERAAVVRGSVNASLPALRFVRRGQQPFTVDDAERFCANAAGSGGR